MRQENKLAKIWVKI